MKKRLLSLAMVACLVLTMIPAVAFAVDVNTAADFITAAAGSEKITLTGNIELDSADIVLNCDVDVASYSIIIKSGATVKIDLNGHTISGVSTEQGHGMIKNSGTLTVDDAAGNGKISYNFTGTPDSAFKKGNYTVVNSGTMTVDGGTIENISTASPHMRSTIDNNSTNGNAVLTINSGSTISCPEYIAIRQFANSTSYENSVTINGGTVTGGQRAVWVQLPGSDATKAQKASLEVTGGTLTSNDSTYNLAVYVTSNGSSAENTEVKVSGGTFNGDVMVDSKVGNTVKEDNLGISGGDFKGTYGFYDYSGKTPSIISGGTFSETSYASYYLTDDAIAAEVTDADGTVYAVGKEAIEEAAADGGATIDITQASDGAALDNLPGGTTVINNSSNDVTVNGQVLGKFGSVDPSYAPELTIPAPTPTQPPVQSGKNYWVKYNGGNNFSTNKKDVPTSVEIDGMPVPFSGDGKNFTVSCILSGAERITVRWNSTSVTTNFKPDANIVCSNVDIPKTGDVSFVGYAVMALVAVAGAMGLKK